MTDLSITTEARELSGRKTEALRAEGKVPAILYGFDIEPTNVTLERNDLERLYAKAGVSTVIKLEVAGKEHEVLIQDLQRDPVSDLIIHADFRRIDMSKKVEASITVGLVGDAPAVKGLGGTLIQSLEEIDVIALPSALVREVSIDISKLETFDDVVRVSDITVPAGIEVQNDAEQTVASVQPPRSEAEMEALDEAIVDDVSQVEVDGEKKDEEGDGEEKAGDASESKE